MFSLYTSGKQIALLPNTRIRFKRRMPAFHNDIIPTEYSLFFLVPVKHNKETFNFQHLPETWEHPEKLPVDLRVEKTPLFKGTIIVDRADRNHYRCRLAVSEGDIDGTLSIRDLMGDTVVYDNGSGDPSIPGVNQGAWPEWDFCFPEYRNANPDFVLKYYHKWVNRMEYGLMTLTMGGQRIPLGLCLYLPAVVKGVCAGLGYSASGDMFLDSEMTKVIIWNNYITEWNSGYIEIPYDQLLPDLSVNEFFLRLKKFFGLNIDIDTVNREIRFDFLDNLLDKPNTVDLSSISNGFRPVTFVEKDGFRVTHEFEHDDWPGNVIQTPEIENDDELDYVLFRVFGSPFPYTEGDVVYGLSENYKYVVNSLLGFDEYSYDYFDHESGEKEFDFSCKASSIPTMIELRGILGGNNYGETKLMPTVDADWSDKTQTRDFGLRFLVFRGLQSDSGGYDYAYATDRNRVMKDQGPSAPISVETDPLGEITLHPEDLTNRYFAKWINYQAKQKEVETFMAFKLRDLLHFKRSQIITIDSTNYLIKELDYVIDGRKGLLPTKATLVKI